MAIRRVAVIFNDRPRPETTGRYCLAALRELIDAVHVYPDSLNHTSESDFDLFLRVDDGMDAPVPARLRPLAWWAIDTHLDFDRCLAQAATADLTFAAQRPGADALRQAGIDAKWLPLACDPVVHRLHPVPKRYDVCFVGNPFPGPRAELVELLRSRYPAHFVGQRYFDEMARTYSESRIVFNRSVAGDLNMRVFEALACGSLLLTDALPESGQDDLFRDGVHLATYRDADELLDKLAFYLARAEARGRVEGAGRREAVTNHTYRQRMGQLLLAAEALTHPVPVGAALLAAAYDPGYFEFDRPELLALIPADAVDVLDVGCGAGRLGAALKTRQPARVVGVEVDPRAAAAARSRLDQVFTGDAETLDLLFGPGSFDVAVCGDVLEHLRDPLAFLRRLRGWLRPGGLLVASLPNVRHHSVIRGLLAGDWTYEPAGLLDRTHLRFFTRREVEKLLYRAGFAAAELAPTPGPGYTEWVAAGRSGEVQVGGLRIGPLPPAEAEEFFAYQWLVTARPADAPDRGLTSIIILAHNELAYTRQCLDSVHHLTDEPFELVVVDNGSTDGTADYLRHLATADPRVRVITNPGNRGFPAGANQGIQAARGNQVLLLNNDTLVTTGWLGRMLRALATDPAVGLVGPCSNRVSGRQQVEVGYDDLSRLDGFAWEWGKMHAGAAEETDRLVGFCLLVRWEVVDRVGLLDERFGLGNFEDDDYCARARQAGFKAVIARDAFVHHFGGETFRSAGVDYDGLMRQNEALFRAKWEGEDSSAAPHIVSKAAELASTTDGFSLRASPGGGLLLERPSVGLSACLIVRDNATTIRACLESLHPWVDELVVIDTGSTDDTPRIAADLGARVFHFPWCDDFSAARNESLRHARGAWVFWMDSDDVIDPANGRGLRELARGRHPDGVLGYVVQVHCPGPGDEGADDVTVVDHVKLFRNRPDLRFEGRIHEQILPAIRQAGGEVAWTDLFVVHSGYDHSPAGQERKRERDLKLLHLELAERPGHPFTLFNLGMTYADISRFEEATGYLEESVRRSRPGESHVRKALALLAHCQSRDGRPGEAVETCRWGLEQFPDDDELRFRLGVLLHEVGRLQEATQAYEAVLAGGGGRYLTSVDRGIRGYKARQNLAVVYADLGDLDRSEAEWRRVVDEVPGYQAGWRGLGEVLLRRGRLDEAAGVANRLCADARLRAEGLLLLGRVLAARGDIAGGRTAWDDAARAAPTDPEPLRESARVSFEAGEYEAAGRALLEVVRLDPADPVAHHNLGAAAMQRGQPDEAAAHFQRSLELRPQWVETLLCLGYASQAAGDQNGAKKAWRAVLDLDPSHQEAGAALQTASG